uniref:Uncharacterized protein n=1 Tax=Panagrolaimus davidi TaxID=227884 RepID=A0A914QD98_9BILA
MKNAIVVVAAILALSVIVNAEICTNDNLEYIENCFNETFEFDFNNMNVQDVFDTYNETRQTMKGIDLICKETKTLKACLLKDKNVVKNCLNVEALKGLSFVNNEVYYAQVLMTILLETEYSCGKGYVVLSKNFDCIKEALASCESNFDNKCDDPFVYCSKEAANDTCGSEAGCYAQKDAAINVCFDESAKIFMATALPAVKANTCSEKSLQVLENCYASLFLKQLNFAYPYLAPNFVEELKRDLSTSDGVIERCKAERIFRKCLRKDTSEDVIKDCVNIESYSGLSFTRNVTKWARQYVASFLETDYVCRNGYQTLVYFNDCIKQVPAKCASQFNDDFDCEYQKGYAECMKDTTAQDCGDAAGCFAYKDATISICYYETTCQYCKNLNIKNNFYDKLCNTDASFNPPSTTATTTPTTVFDNSTINIIVVTRH